jgi:hypothetical protein
LNKKLGLCASILFLVFLIAGCKDVDLSKVSKEDVNKVIVCDPPYMRYASECCLDANSNKICDVDEGKITPESTSSPSSEQSTPDEITDYTFETVDTEISKMHTSETLIAPSVVSVTRGETTKANVFVGNDGSICPSQAGSIFTLTPTLSAGNGKISAKVISMSSVTLKPGEQVRYVIGIFATKDAPLATGTIADPTVFVRVTCNGRDYVTSAFVIEVK